MDPKTLIELSDFKKGSEGVFELKNLQKFDAVVFSQLAFECLNGEKIDNEFSLPECPFTQDILNIISNENNSLPIVGKERISASEIAIERGFIDESMNGKAAILISDITTKIYFVPFDLESKVFTLKQQILIISGAGLVIEVSKESIHVNAIYQKDSLDSASNVLNDLTLATQPFFCKFLKLQNFRSFLHLLSIPIIHFHINFTIRHPIIMSF